MERILKGLFIIFPMIAMAQGGPPSAPISVYWQKVELEKNIKKRFSDIVSPIIKSGEFIINVDVVLNDEAQNASSAASSGSGGDPDGSPPPGAGEARPKRSPIRPNDIDPKDAPKDYLVFSKLGMQTPIYLEDMAPKKNPSESPKAPKPADLAKSLAKISQSFDLFKYIEAIKVNVSLDDFLGDETKETVQKLLKNTKLKYGQISPEVSISFIDMQEVKKTLKKIDPNKKRRENIEMISKFGTALGLILAVVLLGLFSLLLFKKYSSLQEKLIDAMKEQKNFNENQNEDEVSEEENEASLSGTGPGEGDGTAGQKNSVSGIERFQLLLSSNPKEAGLLVKKWIIDTGPDAKSALIALVQDLSSEELSLLFSGLSLNERENWKSLLDGPLSPEAYQKSLHFISNQVVENMIVPSMIDDLETIEMILSLTPEKAAEFVQKEKEMASILLNVTNTQFLSQILEYCDPKKVENLIKSGLNLGKETIEQSTGPFKEALRNYVDIHQKDPFVAKIVELFPKTSLDKEPALMSGLAQSGQKELLLEVSKEYFPAELISSFADESLKRILTSYNRAKRVQLLMVLPQDQKDRYIGLIAPEGSKARDMIDIDMEKFDDEAELKKIESAKDEIWKNFVTHFRSQISKISDLQTERDKHLDDWIKKQKIAKPKSNTPLKKVA